MKIAVISDIHGNFDALSAVLKQAAEEGAKHLLVLGDIVGYYYYPEKILEALSHWNYDIIKGNHEYILEDLRQNSNLKEKIKQKYGSGHDEALKKLNDEQLDYFKNLPDKKSVSFNQTDLLMCHGSPWSNDYYIYPDCKPEIADKCDSSEHDFVLIGHSHYAFAIKNKNSVLLNPGSVGQSRQKGGIAYWCVINTENKSFQMKTTPYNTQILLNDIARIDPNIDYLTKILKR